jgi:recombination protein RecA
MTSGRQRKLDAVIARLQLEYGPRAIRKAAPVQPISHISTTFPELDAALRGPTSLERTGGLPRGRISEIIGPATSGKATLAAKVLSAAHREETTLVAWIDLSRTCDPDYLHRCGLDLGRLLIVRPRDVEDALAIALHLVESNTLAALVFDEVFPTTFGSHWATDGALERLAAVVTETETAVIFLTGPSAQSRTLAHVAAVRLAIRRERWIHRDRDVRGYVAQVEVIKHKLGRAGALVPIRITFNGTVRGDGL